MIFKTDFCGLRQKGVLFKLWTLITKSIFKLKHKRLPDDRQLTSPAHLRHKPRLPIQVTTGQSLTCRLPELVAPQVHMRVRQTDRHRHGGGHAGVSEVNVSDVNDGVM